LIVHGDDDDDDFEAVVVVRTIEYALPQPFSQSVVSSSDCVRLLLATIFLDLMTLSPNLVF
jgi:hypothetical protein